MDNNIAKKIVSILTSEKAEQIYDLADGISYKFNFNPRDIKNISEDNGNLTITLKSGKVVTLNNYRKLLDNDAISDIIFGDNPLPLSIFDALLKFSANLENAEEFQTTQSGGRELLDHGFAAKIQDIEPAAGIEKSLDTVQTILTTPINRGGFGFRTNDDTLDTEQTLAQLDSALINTFATPDPIGAFGQTAAQFLQNIITLRQNIVRARSDVNLDDESPLTTDIEENIDSTPVPDTDTEVNNTDTDTDTENTNDNDENSENNDDAENEEENDNTTPEITPEPEIILNEINGDNKNNRINGTDDHDLINGDKGNDRLSGGLGNDTLIGGKNNDTLYGNEGDDTLNGGDDNDKLFGGAGDDTLIGGKGTDTLNGGAGSDTYLVGDVPGDVDFYRDKAPTILSLNENGETGQVALTQNLDIFPSNIIKLTMSFASDNSPEDGSGNGIGLLSYAVDGSDNEFLVFAEKSGVISLYVNGKKTSFDIDMDTVFDGAFHTLDITYDSIAKTAGLSIDGNINSTNLFNAGAIQTGGTLTLGQEQDSTGGGFDAAQEFSGQIQNVKIINSETGKTAINYDFTKGNTPKGISLHENAKITDIDTGHDVVKATQDDTQILFTQTFDKRNGIEEITADGHENVTIAGNSKNNTLDFSATTLISISSIEGDKGNDTIKGSAGDDIINGGKNNDRLYGNDGDDTLDGGHDHDKLFGGAGNDILIGGAGNDTMDGGEGSDIYLVGDNPNDIDIYTDTGLFGHDAIVVTKDNASVLFTKTFDARNGIEEITANGHENVTITGNSKNNKMDFSEVTLTDIIRIDGDKGHDTITGSVGDDVIEGGKGNDKIYGHEGNDILTGGHDNDQIFGGMGDDVLFGGAGKDTLTGGEGNDTFIIGHLDHADTIKDFESGDVIDISTVLKNYDEVTDALADFVKFTDKGAHSHMEVKDGNKFKTAAIFQNAAGDLNLDDLIADNSIIA